MSSAPHLRGSGFRGLRTRLVPSEKMRQDLSDGVSMLGSSDETGMAVIAPARTDPAVGLLRRLNLLLQGAQVRPMLERLIEEGDESTRQIQAGRYEIFLDAVGKGSNAFDFVASTGGGLPSDAKEQIIRYAVECASRDPRIGGGDESSSEYDFGNFSLIANYDPVPAQAPHIDVVSPNHQFGLIVTENTPSTQFFEVREQNRSIDSLVELWNGFGEVEMETTMPPDLINALKKNYRARSVLESFGDVLLPQKMFRRMKGYSKLETGTLLSLPGNVIHAGPLSEDFRAIVFFSAWPKGSDVTAYDSDTQYSGVLLCGHLVNVLWRQRGVGFPERLFLLRILAHYISEAPVKGMWLHWSEGAFSRLVEALESGLYPKKATKDEYLTSAAKNKNLCAPFHSMDPDLGLIDISDLARVSVHDLVTNWGGDVYNVTVYRRHDGTVILHYPEAKDPDTGSESFEGADLGDNYTLSMNGPAAGQPFDGTNGVLRDTRNMKISCFRKDSRAQEMAAGDRQSIKESSRVTVGRKRTHEQEISRRMQEEKDAALTQDQEVARHAQEENDATLAAELDKAFNEPIADGVRRRHGVEEREAATLETACALPTHRNKRMKLDETRSRSVTPLSKYEQAQYESIWLAVPPKDSSEKPTKRKPPRSRGAADVPTKPQPTARSSRCSGVPTSRDTSAKARQKWQQQRQQLKSKSASTASPKSSPLRKQIIPPMYRYRDPKKVYYFNKVVTPKKKGNLRSATRPYYFVLHYDADRRTIRLVPLEHRGTFVGKREGRIRWKATVVERRRPPLEGATSDDEGGEKYYDAVGVVTVPCDEWEIVPADPVHKCTGVAEESWDTHAA